MRLVRLLDTPGEAPFLAPLVTREIVYRLLRGKQGDRQQRLALQTGIQESLRPAADARRAAATGRCPGKRWPLSRQAQVVTGDPEFQKLKGEITTTWKVNEKP